MEKYRWKTRYPKRSRHLSREFIPVEFPLHVKWLLKLCGFWEIVCEAMRLVFTRYNRECLSTDTAEYVYERTTEGPKLRRFLRDLVIAEGPLAAYKYLINDQFAKQKEEWKELIPRKCDLVVDIVLEGGSFNGDGESSPYQWENHASI